MCATEDDDDDDDVDDGGGTATPLEVRSVFRNCVAACALGCRHLVTHKNVDNIALKTVSSYYRGRQARTLSRRPPA